MTNAFEIRHVSPASPPKSGFSVPPQAVLDASRFQSSPQVDDFPPQPYPRSLGVSPTLFLLNFSFSAFRISASTPMLCANDIILNESPVPIRDRMPGLNRNRKFFGNRPHKISFYRGIRENNRRIQNHNSHKFPKRSLKSV